MRARFCISASRLISALGPVPPTPITAMRPPVASAFRLPARLDAPTSSSTTSNGPSVLEALRVDGARAELLHLRPQLLAAHGGGHPRARHAAELDRRGAHAARRAVHQQVLAGASAAWVKRASWAVVKTSGSRRPAATRAARNRHGGALVHHGELGLGAAAHHRHHPLALLEALGTRSESDHLARQLHTGDVRRRAGRGGVDTPALEHVGAVQAGRPHPHEHLALSGFGIRPLLDDEAPILDGYGAHKRGMYSRVLLMRCNKGNVPSNR